MKKVVFYVSTNVCQSEQQEEFDLVEDLGYSEEEARRIIEEEDTDALKGDYDTWLGNVSEHSIWFE